jgi:hypothetical protein
MNAIRMSTLATLVTGACAVGLDAWGQTHWKQADHGHYREIEEKLAPLT